MKKIYAAIFALCLMCGTTALAAENNSTTINQDSIAKTGSTTVSYTIEENETYTVIIPSSVKLTNSGDKLSGPVSVKLQTGSFNVAGKRITVSLTGTTNGFKLKNGANEIPYNLKAGGIEYGAGSIVLSWTYGDTYTDQTNPLNVQTTKGFANFPAGDYTDTLTFNVSVTENNNAVDQSESNQ